MATVVSGVSYGLYSLGKVRTPLYLRLRAATDMSGAALRVPPGCPADAGPSRDGQEVD